MGMELGIISEKYTTDSVGDGLAKSLAWGFDSVFKCAFTTIKIPMSEICKHKEEIAQAAAHYCCPNGDNVQMYRFALNDLIRKVGNYNEIVEITCI